MLQRYLNVLNIPRLSTKYQKSTTQFYTNVIFCHKKSPTHFATIRNILHHSVVFYVSNLVMNFSISQEIILFDHKMMYYTKTLFLPQK